MRVSGRRLAVAHSRAKETALVSRPRLLFGIARCSFFIASQYNSVLMAVLCGANSTRTPLQMQKTIQDFLRRQHVLEIFRRCTPTTPPVYGLLFALETDVGNPRFIASDSVADKLIAFFVTTLQKFIAAAMR